MGRKLGFEKVSYYAHQFGLGELAGWNIAGEHLGTFPSTELDAKLGGVGKMCSFGESISLTPLQLAALMGAIANGGTLYYLQHPTTPEEIANFTPKVKRKLDIGPLIPEISDGMSGAVEYGTARLLRTNFIEEPILGKTGTCSKNGTRFGWFGSYANTEYGRIVTVVFLEGGRPTFGPKAAELAGRMYRNLYDHDFFAVKPPAVPVRTAATGVGAVAVNPESQTLNLTWQRAMPAAPATGAVLPDSASLPARPGRRSSFSFSHLSMAAREGCGRLLSESEIRHSPLVPVTM